MIGDRTRTIIIGVVTTIWAINFLAGLVVTGYEPSESINGIFMAIVGGLFALGARKGVGGGNNKPDDEVRSAPPKKRVTPKKRAEIEPPDEDDEDS